MRLTKFAVDHATTVFVLILILFIGGYSAYMRLPREAAPDIAIPIVIVSTPYFGVSPSDMETLVTQPMESELQALRNLKKMTSTSAESVSLVTLEFEPDIDIEDALQKVRDKVDKAKPELPPDAEDPEIIEVNASDFPVLIANVAGDLDPARLKELAEDIEEDIEKVPGVLRVDIAGNVEREIQVLTDPARLEHYGISLNDVINSLQSENVNLPGGSIDVGEMKYTVRVPGEFEQVHEMNDIVVKTVEGDPIYLRDVADLRDTYKDPSTYSRLTTWKETPEGRVAVQQTNVSLSVVKRAGENIIDIADAAKEVIEDYQNRVPEGVEVFLMNDMSEMIRARVHELENNIISGLLLVLIVLFFFMGGFRNALFAAISIPLSMLISFLVLSALDITLNMVVLFSLVLALGMLVDNAIVIVENIYRHASQGKSRYQAALDGTTEVGWAVIASTATTVAAFFPLLFWPGVMGKFMGFLPLTVIITLLSSLFVALVINPVLCAVFMKTDDGVDFSEDTVPDVWLYRWYSRSLEWSLNHRLIVVALSIASLIASFMIFASTSRGVELFPESTPERFSIGVEMPDGTRLETTDALLRDVSETIRTDAPEGLVEAWTVDAGVQAGRSMGGNGKASHYGRVTVDMVDVEDQPVDPAIFMARLREVFASIPGASIIINVDKMGPPSGKAVNVEVVGDDLQVLAQIARTIKEQIRTIPGITDLSDDLELTRPEVHVLVDRDRAAVAGVDTRLISQTVRTAINGTEATVFREGDEEYDVMVRLPEESRQSVEDLRKLTVKTRGKNGNEGAHVPLGELATIEIRGGAGSIRHKDQDRVVTISANAEDGYLPANLLKEVQAELGDVTVPAGYSIRYTGENEDQKEAQDFIGNALLAALFLIALILVTQFNSIVQPFIILVSVILSLIGVLWNLILTGEPFGIIMTGIGIISLAGVVVNNAIVLIDYANQLQHRGMNRRQAIVQAGMVRLRPVMLTALTTALGMVPLVIGVSIDFVNTEIVVGGASVEMWGPMARAVTAGLIVATLLTLMVVPVLYSLLDDLANIFKGFFRRRGITGTSAAAAGVVGLLLIALLPALAQAQETSEETSEEASEEVALALRGEPAQLADFEIGAERTLGLAEAKELMREQNLDVASARVQIDVAKSYIKQAYSTLFPTLSANGSYTINQEEIATSFGGDMLPEGAPEPEPIIIQPKTNWRWSVSASMRFNARALSLINQAYTQLDLAETQVDAVQQNLDLAVLQTYYGLLTVRRVMELSAEQLASAETLLNATEARIRGGVATEFERTRARLRVVQAEQELERARLQFIQLRQTLAQILQTPANFDVAQPDNGELKQDLGELREIALRERKDLEAARLNEEFSEQQLREVYWQYLPILGVTFSYSDAKDTGLSESDPIWALIFTADWTIWDGGAREALMNRQEALKVAAQLQREKASSELLTNLETSYADYLSSLTQVESGRTQVELAQEALRQARVAYQYGAATQLDVINAEDQYEVANIALLQDQLALELSVRELENLAGL